MFDLLRSPRRFLLFFFEGVLSAVLVVSAACLRLGLHRGLVYPHIALKALLFSLFIQGSLYYAGFYDLASTRLPRVVFERVLRSAVLASVFLVGIFYIVPALEIGRGIFLVAIALVALVVPAWRVLYNSVAESAGGLRRTLILGNGELAKELATMMDSRADLGMELVGMLARDRAQMVPRSGVIGIYKELYDIVMRDHIQVVLVAYPDRRGTLPVEQLLEIKFRGVEVYEGVDFYEREMGKIFVRELKPSQLIFAEGFTARTTTRRLKRIMDVIVATLGIILSAPLMLLTAIAIRIESPGPFLYKQVRAGEFGKLFTILKFRSMRVDAEKHGAQFAKVNDDRITRVGQFIRKTRLDELPQFWNVLMGEMSMVGPRPERPEFVDDLAHEIPFYRARHAVKPGITGWAQVRYGYGNTVDDARTKLEYDLYYVRHAGFYLDSLIALKTVSVVFKLQGK